MHERLKADDQAEVNHGQQSGQAAIDQRAIDDDIDIPQPVAQNSDAHTKGNGRIEQRRDRPTEQLVPRVSCAQAGHHLAKHGIHGDQGEAGDIAAVLWD